MTAPEIRWIENDMKVDELRKKMILLKQEFEEKNKCKDIKDYDDKLEKYINRRLKQEFTALLHEQFSIITSFLQT